VSASPPAARAGARRFYKLTGSGNDFVFFDVRDGEWLPSRDPSAVAALCARGTGVGADGVVLLDVPEPRVVRIVYLNSDGSRAALCGNATLCTARLASHLGVVGEGEPFAIRTDAGDLPALVSAAGQPSFELGPVRDLASDAPDVPPGAAGSAARIGFAVAGVPHLVVRVPDVEAVDVVGAGRSLRAPSAARAEGANVNFVSRGDGGSWRMRTYERGVEDETLACGTGAVAVATVLRTWGESGVETRIITRSGSPVVVTQPSSGSAGPSLAGEGRLVYEGTLRDWR
jgi:diaminopimelate epimerase